MGSFARLLAEKKVLTREDLYWANVEGDIENVNGVLKITQIRVKYHLNAPAESVADVKEVYSKYINFCPAAQSVIGCIDIKDELIFEK